MMQKLKMLILSLSSMFLFAVPLAVPAAVSAATSNCNPKTPGGTNCITGGVCYGAQNLNVTPAAEGCTEQDAGLTGTIKDIVNILSVVVGIVAVIMIIVGGFRYITSGGSSEKVTAAKNTLLYAIIGLVIVALAQVIVRFVLTKTTGAIG
jgi:hypothetical protein